MELKVRASFFSFVLRSPCVKQVGEKMSTVGIHRNADCLLKYTYLHMHAHTFICYSNEMQAMEIRLNSNDLYRI